MDVPKDRKYSSDHEWVKVNGNNAYVGITDFAQSSLGDIVFVELPEPGKSYSAGNAIGTLESVKAVSDVFTPISGKVLDVNKELLNDPGLINRLPYKSWIVLVEISNPPDLNALLSSKDYEQLLKKER
jgi:glycine cleavage system H protein